MLYYFSMFVASLHLLQPHMIGLQVLLLADTYDWRVLENQKPIVYWLNKQGGASSIHRYAVPS